MGLSGFSSRFDFDSLLSLESLDLDSFETIALGADLGVLDRVLYLSKGVSEFEVELEEVEKEW